MTIVVVTLLILLLILLLCRLLNLLLRLFRSDRLGLSFSSLRLIGILLDPSPFLAWLVSCLLPLLSLLDLLLCRFLFNDRSLRYWFLHLCCLRLPASFFRLRSSLLL